MATPDDPKGSLHCVAPLDAAGIDRVLTEAGSPLAGEGSTFVEAAASVGLDPRALVAIAGHETVLMTYGPAAAINNPFGIGPGHRYPTAAASIQAAAKLLSTGYLAEGRTTLATISSKYAPVGAANDPSNLNANWVGGVGTLYRRLGGNPDQPITLNTQPTSCDGTTTAPQTPVTDPAVPTPNTSPAPSGDVAPAPAPPAGPTPQIWDGTPPTIGADGAGTDPLTGGPATVEGFAFPLAATTPAPTVTATATAATVTGTAGSPVLASITGQLTTATAEEQAEGIAFWVTTRSGERFGYGMLATYESGIMDGALVTAGQPLGTSTGSLVVAWERAGSRVAPTPFLTTVLAHHS